MVAGRLLRLGERSQADNLAEPLPAFGGEVVKLPLRVDHHHRSRIVHQVVDNLRGALALAGSRHRQQVTRVARHQRHAGVDAVLLHECTQAQATGAGHAPQLVAVEQRRGILGVRPTRRAVDWRRRAEGLVLCGCNFPRDSAERRLDGRHRSLPGTLYLGGRSPSCPPAPRGSKQEEKQCEAETEQADVKHPVPPHGRQLVCMSGGGRGALEGAKPPPSPLRSLAAVEAAACPPARRHGLLVAWSLAAVRATHADALASSRPGDSAVRHQSTTRVGQAQSALMGLGPGPANPCASHVVEFVTESA